MWICVIYVSKPLGNADHGGLVTLICSLSKKSCKWLVEVVADRWVQDCRRLDNIIIPSTIDAYYVAVVGVNSLPVSRMQFCINRWARRVIGPGVDIAKI